MRAVTSCLIGGVFAVVLAACGGGGGGGVGPDPAPGPIDPPGPTDPTPGPTDPTNPTDPTDPTTPGPTDPTDPPPVQRGPNAIPGIAEIPLSSIKATNEEMQKMFVVTEFQRKAHGELVRLAACNSYTLQCEDPESRVGKTKNADGTVTTHTGTAPYTSISNLTPNTGGSSDEFIHGEIRKMGTVKIVAYPITPSAGFLNKSGDLPYLAVQSIGNWKGNGPRFLVDLPEVPEIPATIQKNNILYIAGWDRDETGNYLHHELSKGCKGVDEGCLWAEFDLPVVGGGTSVSAPQVASALASVLAVFPDTTHQNLSKFAKACAKKSGQGIEVLLRQSGGVGVADFTCMGGVTQALTNLPAGGRTNVTVNGQTVSVGGADVSLAFAPSTAYTESMAEHLSGYSFNIVPTGGENAMLVGMKRSGSFFASVGVGTDDDFFGFSENHERVRSLRLTAGHENVFAHITRLHSDGGGYITEAVGRSMGLTVREEFILTDDTVLDISARTERFLGGHAGIGSDEVSFGSVRLNGSGWNHRVTLSSETEIDGNRTVNVSADMRLPDGGESNIAVGVRYRTAF